MAIQFLPDREYQTIIGDETGDGTEAVVTHTRLTEDDVFEVLTALGVDHGDLESLPPGDKVAFVREVVRRSFRSASGFVDEAGAPVMLTADDAARLPMKYRARIFQSALPGSPSDADKALGNSSATLQPEPRGQGGPATSTTRPAHNQDSQQSCPDTEALTVLRSAVG